jgi:hypothetical protein
MRLRRRRGQAGTTLGAFLDQEFVVPTDLRVTAEGEGEQFLPAFTSEGALRRFAPEAASLMPLRGSNLLSFLLESECAAVVIDPDEPDSYAISRTEAELVVGPSREALWAGPKILLAPPEEPPPASLIQAFRTACLAEPDVASAYVFLAALPGKESHPQAVLGLELSSGDEISDDLLAAFAECNVPPTDAAAGLGGYLEMDVRVLDADMLAWARQYAVVLYQRDDH